MDTRPFGNDTLLRQLNWRYATKKFDPARRISAVDWETLEEALTLSPSSYGLQPYKFIVVTDPEVRSRLVAASWGQRQPADSSHFVVFANRPAVTAEQVEQYLARIAEVRGLAIETLAPFGKVIGGDLIQGPRAAIAAHWAARQAYIALGNFITSATVLGIDTCPMEGFDPAKYDEILGLPAHGVTAVVACAAGYRAEDDKYAALKKVRLSREELFLHI